MDNLTTFLSYNSTGLDSVKTKWIRDIAKVTKCDFITLQEHFKKTKTIEKYFMDEFPDRSAFVIPGYRENSQDSGRPKGGIAMLSSKSKNVSKKRVKTNSFRVQAQVLTLFRTKLLWINCYMPTDPQTIQYNDEELLNVLTEIENIMDIEDYDDVACMGDRLYKLANNYKLTEAQRSHLGVDLGSTLVSCIGQADDSIFFSHDIFSLQFLLLLTIEYCQ